MDKTNKKEDHSSSESEETIAHLLWQSTTWAVVNGLVLALPKSSNPAELQTWVTHIPFTLQPFPYPEALFQKATTLQKPINLLVDKVSRDVEFLYKIHEQVSEVDEFTRNLIQVSKAVHSEGLAQNLFLGIHRADYMLHTKSTSSSDWSIRQVEVNTISASFGALSTKVTELHQFLAEIKGDTTSKIPQSQSGTLIPAGIAKAFQANTAISNDVKQQHGVVLFVIQPHERNIADQRLFELQLWKEHRIHSLRMQLRDVHQLAHLDTNRNLLLPSGKVAVVVYYRAGYTPLDYPSVECWDARVLIERSTAVKCPSIDYHITGTKKTQQMLYQKDILRRYLGPDEAVVNLVHSCFAPQYSLLPEDNNEKVIEEAKANWANFVMKPQREGGGNLVAGSQLQEMLSNLTPSIRKSYILMERIDPPQQQGRIARMNSIESGSLVSELGIYGVFLGDGRSEGGVVANDCAGFLLRSKLSNYADGGVCAGIAALDAVQLI